MKFATFVTTILLQPLGALTIRIDYTYDTTNFFNTAAKRNAIEAVAGFYGNLIQDQLLRIDNTEFGSVSWTAFLTHPATGNSEGIVNLVVPEETIIVYVGARELGGSVAGSAGPGGWSASGSTAWLTRIRGRGSAAAANTNAALNTDFSPWGGSIAFDITTTWNFSQNQNLGGTDFVKIALHEMGHVLGIGTADSWDNQISGGTFTGAAVLRSYGSAPPIQSGGGHFNGSLLSKSFGAFGMAHGSSRPVLMLPSSTDDGINLDVASDLDLAALVDCGWEISPPAALVANTLGPGGASFSWRTSSFFDYRIQESTTLQSFAAGSPLVAGNGTVRSWTDPSPPAGEGFYRLAATPVFSPPTSAASIARVAAEGIISADSEPIRTIEDCGHAEH